MRLTVRSYLMLLFTIFAMVAAGCNKSDSLRDRDGFDRAVKAVQNSHSRYPGADTKKALEMVLAMLAREGYQIKEEGWTCTYAESAYFVRYNLKVNGRPVKFHWILGKNNIVYPADELTRNITFITSVNE